jgi:uncharacterized membrane protein
MELAAKLRQDTALSPLAVAIDMGVVPQVVPESKTTSAFVPPVSVFVPTTRQRVERPQLIALALPVAGAEITVTGLQVDPPLVDS